MIRAKLVARFDKMMDAGKRFESAKDDFLIEARKINPAVKTVTDAIRMLQKIEKELNK